MRKKLVFLMCSLMALTLGLGLGSANAAWTTGHTLQTVLVTADASKLNPVKGGTADPVYTLGASEGLTINDTIRIDLTGGAVWAAIPTLKPSAGDLGAGAGVAATPLSGGQIGDNYAIWRAVDALVIAGTTLTLNSFTVADFDVRAVANKANVDITMTLTTGTGQPIGTVKSMKTDIGNYAFTGAPAETVALTAKTDTADVGADTGVYTKFTGNTLNGTATVLTFTNDSGPATLPVNTAVSANKILLTLVGDFTGIASVSAAGFTGCDATGSITGGTANFFLINAAKTHAYACNTAALAAAGVLAAAPTFVLDGTTAQTARVFQAVAQVLVDGTNWTAHSAMESTTLYTIDRNGAQVYAAMVVGSGNQGWGGGFRIVNRGAVNADVYFQAQAIGGAWSASTLYGTQSLAGQSMYVSADTVFTTCGLPDTTTGNAIITVNGMDTVIDISQTATTPNGHTIIPLTKTNNQAY